MDTVHLFLILGLGRQLMQAFTMTRYIQPSDYIIDWTSDLVRPNTRESNQSDSKHCMNP